MTERSPDLLEGQIIESGRLRTGEVTFTLADHDWPLAAGQDCRIEIAPEAITVWAQELSLDGQQFSAAVTGAGVGRR